MGTQDLSDALVRHNYRKVPLLVKEAKAVARQWVMEEGCQVPGFAGAYYAGSTTWLPDDATLPATSDVDVMVVVEPPQPAHKLGKFRYQDVLLEVTYLSKDQLRSPEQILSHYHLAGSFRTPNLIVDPSGQLSRLQAAVAKDYAKRHWVHQRCLHATNKILDRLQPLDASAPFHDQVVAWLFAAGGAPHVLLVAGLKNPTVRRRYVAVQALLTEVGLLEFYPPLLELLGCAQLSRGQVEQHLAALTAVFDGTAGVMAQRPPSAAIKAPFFFASDLSESARPVALDGSRELIEHGWHREAIFWMLATYSRCQQVLAQDAPVALQDRFMPGYRALLADLGITSSADLQQRREQVQAFLPRLWEVTNAILAANPDIQE